MGIADIRRALEAGIDGKAQLLSVKLGYANGGKEQLLRYSYRLNKEGAVEVNHEVSFPGTDDPNVHALKEGQRVASELNNLED